MSGQEATSATRSGSNSPADQDSPSTTGGTAARIRVAAGVASNEGPPDSNIVAAVQAVEVAFEFWYLNVMREAVSEYRRLIVGRINPFVRCMQFEGRSADDVATALMRDYESRVFVTAGGWLLEALALEIGIGVQKSAAKGFDLERFDPVTNTHHLYVLKSGTVTRNSDILEAVRGNLRQAGSRLRQKKSARVEVHYVVAAGKPTSTYDNGYHRPSSAAFWAQLTALSETKAIDLVLEVMAEAGRNVRAGLGKEADRHLKSMTNAGQRVHFSPDEFDSS